MNGNSDGGEADSEADGKRRDNGAGLGRDDGTADGGSAHQSDPGGEAQDESRAAEAAGAAAYQPDSGGDVHDVSSAAEDAAAAAYQSDSGGGAQDESGEAEASPAAAYQSDPGGEAHDESSAAEASGAAAYQPDPGSEAQDESREAEAAGASGGGGSAGGTSAAAASGPAEPAGPGELLGEVRAIRRRARRARHAYWFPLVLFGVLTCASVPFYLPPTTSGTSPAGPPGPLFLQSGYLGGFGFTSYRGTAYYWLGAMLLGIAATVIWYRWRGNRVGLRTPARGYLITGLIIVALALLIPLAGRGGGIGMLIIMPGDLLVRGTFPFVLIGLGLCFLAWAERSTGLAAIATLYLALALVASLYDIENVFYNWFGWNLTVTESALPNVLLPAVVLLLSGAGTWVVQRHSRPRAEATAEG